MNNQKCGVAVDDAPCGKPAVAYQPVRPLRTAGGQIHWTGPLGPGILLLCTWHYTHPPTDWDPPRPTFHLNDPQWPNDEHLFNPTPGAP